MDLFRAIGPLAALDAARVVGDDGAVGEVAGQCPEPRGAHRLPDQHQRRCSARPVPAAS
jgi:hypothetical protein